MPSIRKNLTIAIILFCAYPAIASDKALSIEEIIVSTFRPSELWDENLKNTYIIDEIAIKNAKDRSITDLLRNVPGVQVAEFGGRSSIYLRGGEANFTMIMINGIQVNDPTNSSGGAFDVSSIDLATISRIEIIRGPQSTFFGSDALSGVINFITSASADSPQLTLTGAGGTDSYHRASASYNYRSDELMFNVSVSDNNADEQVEGNTAKASIATINLLNKISQSTQIQLTALSSSSEKTYFPEDSGGPEFAVNRDLEESESDDLAIGAALEHSLNKWYSFSIQANHYDHEEEIDSPGISPFSSVPPNYTDIQFKRNVARFIQKMALNKALILNTGIDYREEISESEGYVDFGSLVPTSFELTRRNKAYFSKLDYDVTSAITLSAIIRKDEINNSPNKVTGGADFRFETGDTYVSLRWGTGFKTPSTFALGHALVGNPNLKPEESESFEVFVSRSALSGKALFEISAFKQRYTNLVDFDPVGFTNINRGRVNSNGADLLVRLKLSQSLSTEHSVSYLNLDTNAEPSTLRGRAKWTTGGVINYSAKPLSATLRYNWKDSVVDASRHTGTTEFTDLKPYWLFGCDIAYQFSNSLNSVFTIENLFDNDYEQAVGFPAPGVSFKLALNFQI